MPGGRPPVYDKQMIDKVDEYLATCVDEEYRKIKSEGENSTSYENKIKVNLPSLAGLAVFLGCSKPSLYEWAEKDKEFSYALDKVRVEQELRLLNRTLSGDYNSSIGKLALSSNHGYKEKSDVTTDDERLDGGVVILPTKHESNLEATTQTDTGPHTDG